MPLNQSLRDCAMAAGCRSRKMKRASGEWRRISSIEDSLYILNTLASSRYAAPVDALPEKSDRYSPSDFIG